MFRLKTNYHKLVIATLFIVLGLMVLPFWTWAVTLTVVDGYDQMEEETLLALGSTSIVQTSDNKQWETEFGNYTSFQFSDVNIPSGSTITSVVISCEHWEDPLISTGSLVWRVGTGWPSSPVVWASNNTVPSHGEENEATDSWNVTSDGALDSSPATVSITVTPVNDPPVADSQSVTTDQEIPVAITLTGSDVDGDMLTFAIVTNPINGVLSGMPPNVTYTPNALFVGSDSFTFKANDGILDSNPATISITVNPAIPPGSATLTVVDGWDEKKQRTLEQEGKTYKVQTSDNDWWKTKFGFYTAYRFSDVSIPAGVAITSVIVYVEHWEEESFGTGGLQWKVGTSWPSSPIEWGSTTAIPIREGEWSETTDTWDVTSFVKAATRVNEMELYIGNNDVANEGRTQADYLYVVVQWGTPDSTPPAAPSALVATAGNQQVTLDWADNTESDLAGYNVYRGAVAGGPYNKINTALVTVSNYTDTGLTNGATYYYVVTAVDNSSNESGYSNEASATPTVPPPTDVVSYPFSGITRTHRTTTYPRPLNMNILEIDLTAPGISLFVTEPNPNRTGPNDEVLARKTSTFVADFGVQVGINGDFASTPRVPEYEPRGVKGLAASNGVQYSTDDGRPALTFTQLHEPYIGRAPFPSGLYNAVGGNKMLVENGQAVEPATWDPIGGALELHPRTSTGISLGGKLIIIVVDGRQTGFSEGVTLPEMAEYLIEFGAYTGLNHDGGGSSTLVFGTPSGPQIINYPSDTAGERVVANHFGISASPIAAPLAQAQSDTEFSKPASTVLLSNYPNPVNPETWIPFALSGDAHVVIRIYNMRGQLIRTLDLGNKSAGVYVSRDKAGYWDGRNVTGEKVANGVYFYLMEAGTFRAIRKMVIMK